MVLSVMSSTSIFFKPSKYTHTQKVMGGNCSDLILLVSPKGTEAFELKANGDTGINAFHIKLPL